jgi:hypothetical protein
MVMDGPEEVFILSHSNSNSKLFVKAQQLAFPAPWSIEQFQKI